MGSEICQLQGINERASIIIMSLMAAITGAISASDCVCSTHSTAQRLFIIMHDPPRMHLCVCVHLSIYLHVFQSLTATNCRAEPEYDSDTVLAATFQQAGRPAGRPAGHGNE